MPVDLWWAETSHFDDRMVGALTAEERTRWAAVRRVDDRRRFALGALLLRRAAADHLDLAPGAVPVERTCSRCGAAHGRPRLPGSGLHASVTHSGGLVGVAIAAGAPVGLDVEEDTAPDAHPRRRSVVRRVVSGAEPAPRTTQEFLRYWTRKESVVKATGVGLTIDLRSVLVSGPQEAPALLGYRGRTPAASMLDLEPATGYVAALTVLVAGGIDATHRFPAVL
ncbi:MAG: 4'-phosphopantetheinyl transferase superfamily protein [Blastococcus sp.]